MNRVRRREIGDVGAVERAAERVDDPAEQAGPDRDDGTALRAYDACAGPHARDGAERRREEPPRAKTHDFERKLASMLRRQLSRVR